MMNVKVNYAKARVISISLLIYIGIGWYVSL